MTAITKRAMLVKLHIRSWTAQKHDRKVSNEISERHNTDPNTGRFYKQLLTSPALTRFQQNAEQARVYHAAQTMPWLDAGNRVLPTDLFWDFRDGIAIYKNRAEEYAQEFVDGYDESKERAKEQLKDLYIENDYPSKETIAKKFGIDVHFMPIPEANDWRVDLGVEEEAAIKADIEGRLVEAQTIAMNDLWHRIYGAVDKIQERLSDNKKIFRNTLITNMQEIVELLPKMNIMDDPDLERMGEEVRLRLCSTEPETLRDDDEVRAQVAHAASEIMDRVGQYMN